MLKRVIIIPYKMGSKSGRLLKEGLVQAGIRCFRKREDSGYVPHPKDLVIYYGGLGDLHWPHPYKSLNKNRQTAQNKLLAFQAFKNNKLSTVEWTADHNVAYQWYKDKHIVVGRQTLTGHSGQGITIQQWEPEGIFSWLNTPLFTKYQKKTYECRVHVFNGKVIDAQIKRKRTTDQQDAANTFIRNAHTGWVYCRDGFELPQDAATLSIAAVAAVGLNFGAVDLIYNKHHNQFYLLEVNTAPGLEGTTLANYIKEIINVCKTN